MKIECVPVPGKKFIVAVHCDGDFWRYIHKSIFGYTPSLPSSKETDVKAYEIQFLEFEYRYAKTYALKRLSKQSMPSMALQKVLRRYFVSEVNISRICKELSEQGFINDNEWAASYVRCQSRRRQGPRAIGHKLHLKGFSSEETKQVLKEVASPETQRNLIRSLLATKYSKRNLSDYKEKQKVIGGLVRRGFDLELIMDLV